VDVHDEELRYMFHELAPARVFLPPLCRCRVCSCSLGEHRQVRRANVAPVETDQAFKVLLNPADSSPVTHFTRRVSLFEQRS